MRRGAAGGIAVLPMYDRPEIRAETDALWSRLREAIRDAGLDAPETLDRARPMRLALTAPELVLGQTCGLPYIRALAGRVGLVGAPAYDLEGCAPGEYRSALIARPGAAAGGLAALRGARPALNARDSQSGYGALMAAAAPHARGGGFFGPPVITGAHAASVAAVAEGRADVAAIDAVSWALAQRFDRAAGAVEVVGWTAPTPGLPFVTGRARHAERLAGAAEAAIAALDRGVAEALLLTGFRRFVPGDYTVIRRRLAEAEAVHALPAPAPGGGG